MLAEGLFVTEPLRIASMPKSVKGGGVGVMVLTKAELDAAVRRRCQAHPGNPKLSTLRRCQADPGNPKPGTLRRCQADPG